jgi:hypothetical protein
VVDLLVHSGRLSGDALAATVVDLAARGWLHLEQIAPGEVLCRFARQPPTDDELREHEHQVLALLRTRAGAEDRERRVVPAGALGQGVADEADRWWDRFSAAVVAEGEARGLVRRGAFGSPGASLLNLVFGAFVLLLATGALVAAALVADPNLASVIVALAIGLGLGGAYFADVGGGRAQLTPVGIALGSRWLTEREQVLDRMPDDLGPAAVAVRGRTLAYACAVGSAPAVARGLPRGPDSTRAAWVRRGDLWQRVRLSYPVRLPRGWGRPPLTTILPALGGVLLAGAVLVAAAAPGPWHPAPPFSDAAADVLGDFEPVVAGTALVVFLFALGELAAGLFDLLTAPRELEGPVVARWRYGGSPWNPWRGLVPRRWYLVIDDGRSRTLRGVRVSEHAFHHAHRGDLARVRVGRAQGFVRDIELQHP